MVSGSRKNIWRDESGAALIEFTAAALTFLLLLFGVVEFANVYYQWNAATKAVQLGARLAAVSDPVAEDLLTLTGMEDGALPGEPMPAFDFTCQLGDTGCDNNKLSVLVYGRCDPDTETPCPRTNCIGTGANIGMCNIFTRVTPQNVIVRYQYTGLGYAGRPGGAVPTVTVSITGLTYDFILIGGLAGLGSMQLPSFATTVTGEDLQPFSQEGQAHPADRIRHPGHRDRCPA
jgi:Flp pilus assembly pilin Flp